MRRWTLKDLLAQLQGNRALALADLALKGPHRLSAKERTYTQGRLIQLNQTINVVKFMIDRNAGKNTPVSDLTQVSKTTQVQDT